MNLIVGFLILIVLVGSELVGSQPVENVWLRMAAVLATVSLVPGLAFFQTAALLRKMRSQQISFEGKRALCQRLTISHALAWLSASLAIIWALRWQDVVRVTWRLDAWPLIDELLILFPIVISLVASWVIFYELQVALSDDDEYPEDASASRSNDGRSRSIVDAAKEGGSLKHWLKALRESAQPRIDFVSIRFRLYFLLVLAPVCMFVLIRDMAGIFSTLSQPVAGGLFAIGFLALVVVFPFLILLIWKTAPIEDATLRNELLDICSKDHLHVADVRIWKTGNQIVNAVVVGLIPRLRLILLSDGLLNQFKRNEIEAVLRHEAGHLRLWHMPTRLMFMVFPLAALAISDSRALEMFTNEKTSLLIPEGSTAVMLVVFGIYVWFSTRWLSHQMEYEADMYSIQSAGSSEDNPDNLPICHRRASDMKDALLRLAAISPGEFERATFFHPDIRSRIELIATVQAAPGALGRFKQAFERRRRILAMLVVFACAMVFGFRHLPDSPSQAKESSQAKHSVPSGIVPPDVVLEATY